MPWDRRASSFQTGSRVSGLLFLVLWFSVLSSIYMHELPVTQGILDLVLETARQAGAQRIVRVDLVIGDMSSIVDDSVQFYFDILSRGTPAEGAEMHFRRESAVATCPDCGHTWSVSPPLLPCCPACGGERPQVTGGKEFYVESIEVDDEDPGGERYSERE